MVTSRTISARTSAVSPLSFSSSGSAPPSIRAVRSSVQPFVTASCRYGIADLLCAAIGRYNVLRRKIWRQESEGGVPVLKMLSERPIVEQAKTTAAVGSSRGNRTVTSDSGETTWAPRGKPRIRTRVHPDGATAPALDPTALLPNGEEREVRTGAQAGGQAGRPDPRISPTRVDQ